MCASTSGREHCVRFEALPVRTVTTALP